MEPIRYDTFGTFIHLFLIILHMLLKTAMKKHCKILMKKCTTRRLQKLSDMRDGTILHWSKKHPSHMGTFLFFYFIWKDKVDLRMTFTSHSFLNIKLCWNRKTERMVITFYIWRVLWLRGDFEFLARTNSKPRNLRKSGKVVCLRCQKKIININWYYYY